MSFRRTVPVSTVTSQLRSVSGWNLSVLNKLDIKFLWPFFVARDVNEVFNFGKDPDGVVFDISAGINGPDKPGEGLSYVHT